MTWMLLWKIVLLFTIACFVLMAVIVTIGGVFDIRKLFRRLHDD